MASFAKGGRNTALVLLVVVGGLSFLAAQLIADATSTVGLAITLGVVVAIICFVWPEIGLYVLLLSMLLSPEIIVSGAGGGATGSRGVTLRMDDFLMLVLAFAWFARGAVYKDLQLLEQTRLNGAIAIYLLVAAVSTMVGMLFDRVSPVVGALFVIKYAEYIVVYFAVVNYVHTKAQLRSLVRVAFVTAILVALYGVIQIPQGLRVSAPFEGALGEPNTFGGYLLFMMSILGGLMVSAPGLRTAARYAAGLALLGLPFLFTLSRASYLGLLVAAPIIIILSRKKVIAAFGVVTLLLALLFVAPPAVMERISFTLGGQRSMSGQITVGSLRLDTSTSARLQSTGQILSDLPRHPVLGYGVTGYGFVDGQYQRVLIETGLLGLSAFFWLLFLLFREGWRSRNLAEGWWEEGICVGYLAGLAGLLFHALGTNSFIIVRIMEPFWFFTGVIVVLERLNAARRKAAAEEEGEHTYSRGLLSPL